MSVAIRLPSIQSIHSMISILIQLRQKKQWRLQLQKSLSVYIGMLESKIRWCGELREGGPIELTQLSSESWRSYFRFTSQEVEVLVVVLKLPHRIKGSNGSYSIIYVVSSSCISK